MIYEGEKDAQVLRLIWFLLGFLIGSWIGRPLKSSPSQAPASDASRAERLQSVQAPAVTTFAPVAGEPDDLTAIKGIGPAFVEKLKALGITTYADLAQQNPDLLAERFGGRPTAERIRRERWIEQAQAKREGQ
ncbi:MAG: DUF4332 domain-containing protein [Anaerolineae bacterium]|nr:DUF4332 domain-containing protein [Anaerolineae bacterium]